MQNELDQRTIADVETMYGLSPIRGARVADINAARNVRSMSILAYRAESERLLTEAGRTDEMEDLTEDVRERALQTFPFDDAYTILSQLQLSRCAKRGIVPLSDEMFPEDRNPAADLAWVYISQLEKSHGLSNSKEDLSCMLGEWNTDPLRIIRMNLVTEYGSNPAMQSVISSGEVKTSIAQYYRETLGYTLLAEELPPRVFHECPVFTETA